MFGKLKGSPNPLALVRDGGRGRGSRDGRGHGRGRFEKGSSKEDGNGGTTAGAGKAKGSGTCRRCKATGHYSDSGTTKLCDRCGGRGYESSKCGSPVDMETVFAAVEALGDDAVEKTSF